jgi:hypothetical protein
MTADRKQAVVYATITEAPPGVVLREPGAKERHESYLRALVKLEPAATQAAGKAE